MKRYVITGGPGRGKSTLIEILAARGYGVVPEAARIIIEEELSKNSDALPWKNLSLFQAKVAQKQLDLESEAVEDTLFLDRGIVDGYGYCMYGKISVPASILENIERNDNRYDKVFILESISGYKSDKTRFEDEKMATDIHDAIVAAYDKFGYKPIIVPALPPEQRADFVIAHIA